MQQKEQDGKPGHEGRTLKRSGTPDHTETYPPDVCENCQTSLEGIAAVGEEERQGYDIPEIRIKVTLHRAEIIICPECGMENTGKFPESVGGVLRVTGWLYLGMSFLKVSENASEFTLSMGTCGLGYEAGVHRIGWCCFGIPLAAGQTHDCS
ncbi:MAG: hypothetical protein D3924_08585 [Candidatus Electrothrix sp. AR4]|nr:hypothetical protein [Candidatus Electrothrix sp. AR4]